MRQDSTVKRTLGAQPVTSSTWHIHKLKGIASVSHLPVCQFKCLQSNLH